jgi:proteic killer suppression protein
MAQTICRYTLIKSFRHKGIQKFFETGSKAKIQPMHAKRLTLLLAQLNISLSAEEMNLKGRDWHALKGDMAGHWAVSVNGNWRITFTFDSGDAALVDYRDYH